MQPLRIDLDLAGLIAVPERGPYMLDATLLALACQGQRLPALTADLLPLQAFSEGDAWHWMASAWIVRYCGPSTARFLFRNARPTDMLADAQAHSATRVYLDRGITRTVKTRIQLRQATQASAWCIGDADALHALLAQLHNLGAMRHLGFGSVTGVHITPDAQAAQKSWLRPVAAQYRADPYLDQRIAVQGQSTPAYWDRSTQITYIPSEFI